MNNLYKLVKTNSHDNAINEKCINPIFLMLKVSGCSPRANCPGVPGGRLFGDCRGLKNTRWVDHDAYIKLFKGNKHSFRLVKFHMCFYFIEMLLIGQKSNGFQWLDCF